MNGASQWRTAVDAAAGEAPALGIALRIHESGGTRLVKPSRLPISIGRSVANDVCLDLPGVSARHALLDVDEHGLVLRDLGSTNGTWVGGQRVTETRIDGTTSVHLSAALVEIVLAESLPTTRPDARPLGEAGAAVRRGVALAVGALAACYVVVLLAVALDHYATDWPPERGSMLVADAFYLWVALVVIASGLSVLYKLHAKRYRGPRLLATVTALAVFHNVMRTLEPTLVYNLRFEALRAAVPTLLSFGAVTLCLLMLARTAFETWSRRRCAAVALALASTGFGASQVYGRYDFADSSRRDDELGVGLPLLFDPARGAASTGAVMDALKESISTVDAYRETDWTALQERERGADAEW